MPDTDEQTMQQATKQAREQALLARMHRASALCARLRLPISRPQLEAVLAELLPGRHPTAVLVPPLHCDLGGNITLGEHAFLNAGCVLLDMGPIRIGARSLLGPGCKLCTPHHPLDAHLRRTGKQDAYPVTIGEQCWLGANVIVCPGVTIGDRAVIAAGSVVTADIPADCLAAGRPARVIRNLKDHPAPSHLEDLSLAREQALAEKQDDVPEAFARMRQGLPYNAGDPVCQAQVARAATLSARLSSLCPEEPGWADLMARLVPNRHPDAALVPPYSIDFGSGLVLEEGAFCNAFASILDSAVVHLGRHTLAGPHCHMVTPIHPLAADERARKRLYAAPVTIEDDCWLGAGVTVCPGVTIGARSIVAAGSVVTRDIPADSLAAGCPAMVKRSLAGTEPEAADPGEGRALERMRQGLLYDFHATDVLASSTRALALCARLRASHLGDPALRTILRELIPNLPDSATICPPFHCDHGHGILLGEHVFLNARCVILDSGQVRIGDNCFLGPDCQLCTPYHPKDWRLRRHSVETAAPITIGEDCWLGAGVVVCPGVTIGPRSVIAAGSVVTRDIPADSLAAGTPAVVKRSLGPGARSRLEAISDRQRGSS